MAGLIQEETDVIRGTESAAVRRLKKLMMMSVSGTLHIHALRLIKRELGLPEDFRDSILGKYSGEFELVDLETVRLIGGGGGEGLRVSEVEKWREREYKEKWLSEFETKYAFPIDFPTGFKIPAGFHGGLRVWQRLPYAKPYDREVGSSREPKRFEKRAMRVLHELLSLTVEKAVGLDRLVHFRRVTAAPSPSISRRVSRSRRGFAAV